MWMYIIIPSASVGALLILLVIVLCVRRQKHNSKGPSVMKGPYCAPVTDSSVGRHPGQQLEMNALLPSAVSPLQGPAQSRMLVPEIAIHAVRFQQDLGEGAFGKVRFI